MDGVWPQVVWKFEVFQEVFNYIALFHTLLLMRGFLGLYFKFGQAVPEIFAF